MRRFAVIAALLLLAAACASSQVQRPPEKLYFAVELRSEGVVVGKPKLLGETGKPLRVERRQPGASVADYQLRLFPSRDGERFKLSLDAEVKDARGHQELALLHGQERKLELGHYAGELSISVTLMKVDSPEFRALMGLIDEEKMAKAAPGAGAI